jgi:hypothetical protein
MRFLDEFQQGGGGESIRPGLVGDRLSGSSSRIFANPIEEKLAIPQCLQAAMNQEPKGREAFVSWRLLNP